MKPPPFAYHAPERVDDALALLADLGEDGKVLAGGQSLVPLLNFRLASPAALVDITRISVLDAIEVDDEVVRVGAGVRQSRLERHDAAAAVVPLLRRALRLVAHAVIRNRGTAVGSVAHADPAAELPAVLVLLGGTVEARSTAEGRTIAAAEFFEGPLESALLPPELAVAVRFPAPPPRSGTAITELARRHGDYAVAGVCALVTLDGDGRVATARATVLATDPVPRLVGLDDALAGHFHDAAPLEDAAAAVRAAISPRDDLHATADYRRHVAGVLARRALTAAATEAAARLEEEA